MHSLVFPRTKSSFAQRAITLHKSDHRSLCTHKHYIDKHTHTETKKNLRTRSHTPANLLNFAELLLVLCYIGSY